MKKALCLLLAFAVAASCLSIAAFAETDAVYDGDVCRDNFLRITSASAFGQGESENLTVDETVGDGALVLSEGQTEGTWISPVFTLPAFEYAVASWGADTPGGSWVEIRARAYVDAKDAWCDWLSWGKWGVGIKRSSTDQSNDLCLIDCDTFTVRGSDGETASQMQIMAVLHADGSGASPALRNVAMSLKNTLDGQAIPVFDPYADEELPEKVLLDSPCYSQMIRDSAIGNVICSPTSMTMILNDRDPALDLFPEETALREYDFHYEGFGNWSYTVAIAGSYGYSAIAHYADLDFVRHELAHGRNVALSVRYSTGSGAEYYLENGAISSTSGHLITVVGYETVDGVDYFYSNDSAANSDVSCAQRRYRADQLENCWPSRIAYVVADEPEQNAGFAAPVRVEAALSADAENPGRFDLTVGGEKVELNQKFSAKTGVMGAGTCLLILDDAAVADLPAPTRTTTANSFMTYLNVSGGQVSFADYILADNAGKSGTVYVICNDGVTYVAPVTFPEQEAAPAEDASPAEDIAPEAQSEKAAPEMKNVLLIAAAVLVAAALVFVFVKKGKKK